MRITDLLQVDKIILELKGQNKQAVLEELAQSAALHYHLPDPRKVLDVVLARERVTSTAIGQGVAIPHGKMPGVDQVLAILGRSVQGVDFQSPDGHPTHLFFLLIAPEDAPSDHLKALAKISRLLMDSGLRGKLLKGKTEQEIFSVIEEEDRKL